MNFKSIVTATAVVATLATAGCTATERRTAQGAAVGAAAGGVIGAATTGTLEGAATGAAIGGAAGAFIGYATTPGYCIYEDKYGRRYEAQCAS